MALLLALALFAVGWYLIDAGMDYIGLLIIAGGVLALVFDSKPKKTHAKAQSQAQAQQPIIIRTGGGQAPPIQTLKLKIKEPWSGTTNVEDFFSNMSEVVLWPVKIVWRLMRIGKK